jgi:cystathionine beta-lyase
MWVADMDFEVPPAAVEAIIERAHHGVFGYTDPSESYMEAVCNWLDTHEGWRPSIEWLTVTPGVVYALSQAVCAFTEPGDAVLIQPPVYYPFRAVIQECSREVAYAPLVYSPEAAEPYSIDFEAFERVARESGAKLFLLCNPHNPVGRVWREDELKRLGDICAELGIIVVSDEIHADFARPGYKHVSFASLGDKYQQNCVICTAPSKTFNLAGLQTSNIFTPNDELRIKFDAAVESTGYGNINVFGMAACEACYTQGDEWLDELKDYLEGNLAFLKDFIAREIPALKVIEPQSTYLVWVDCSGLGLNHSELRDLFENRAKLWLDHGAMFGPEGKGFMRFNIATQRATIKQALQQLKSAIADL